MTQAENIQDPSWHELHQILKEDLQREILFTRELLSNMHQEEVSLMLQDKGTLNLVLEQQFHLFERLSALRLHRQEVTSKIEKIVVNKKKIPSLEELLPSSDDISTEILSLSDQLVSLTQRMQTQRSYNQHLEQTGKTISFHQQQMETPPRAKRKASIATYHLKK